MNLKYLFPALVCAAVMAGEAEIPGVQARQGENFVESIGVNIQLAADRSTYAVNAALIKPRLLELGVRHVRDTVSYDRKDQIAKLKELAKAGIKCHLVLKPLEAVAVCKLLPGAVVSIEPPDEPDRGAEGWPDAARTAQKNIFKAMKADPATKNIPVMAPGLHNPLVSYEKLGTLADSIDYGTMHVFPGAENPSIAGWGLSLAQLAVKARLVCGPAKSIFITEAGYHNKLEHPDRPGLPEAVVAKYLPRLLLRNFYLNYPRTHIFELMDTEPDPHMTAPEKHYGLLRADGTPKPAFLAVKKLIEAMRDPGPLFPPEKLAYKLENPPKELQHVLFQKRDGSFQLLLWLEVPSYDAKLHQDIVVPMQDISITLGSEMAQGSMWYPLRDGDRPRILTNLENIQIPVNDEILLVEFKKK